MGARSSTLGPASPHVRAAPEPAASPHRSPSPGRGLHVQSPAAGPHFQTAPIFQEDESGTRKIRQSCHENDRTHNSDTEDTVLT